MDISFKAKLWVWSGQGAWHFISLPSEYYEDIRHIAGSMSKKGFGSVRVDAKIAKTSWKTSIFPDTKTKAYLLPVKKEVRTKELLKTDSLVEVFLKIDFS